jgi:hypothetical protein
MTPQYVTLSGEERCEFCRSRLRATRSHKVSAKHCGQQHRLEPGWLKIRLLELHIAS